MGLCVLMLAGCEQSASVSPAPDPTLALVGADISSLERIEQAGGAFRNAGQAGDAIAILRAHGSTTFRLRVFVNPSQTGVEVNDLAYTIRLAVRVKSSGAKLLLDLHYSDTWADPGHQTTPAAWASFGLDSLEQRVENYTTEVVTELKQAGATPDIVQVGNEIDAGILWPLGQIGSGSDSLAQWEVSTRASILLTPCGSCSTTHKGATRAGRGGSSTIWVPPAYPTT
jgi:arabinogalactan endo-1,4-beta-galactosidase